jgi:hypothetical protein
MKTSMQLEPATMRSLLHHLSRRLPRGALGLFALVVLTLILPGNCAAEFSAPVSASALVADPGISTAPFAAGAYDALWTFLENTLNNRARMLQFGIIGMCVALYFMFRARD